MVRYIFYFIALTFSVTAFSAPSGFTFKSSELSQIIELLAEASPELVTTGTVSVENCGTYDAYTTIEKLTSERLAQDYVFDRGEVPDGQYYMGIDALGWATAAELAAKIGNIYRQSDYSLHLYDMRSYTTLQDGAKVLGESQGTAFFDTRTGEYLLIDGNIVQDDCD
jgi:hypothetical protein